MYEWGNYCSYKSPPSCGISERNNCGSSPGHLLGENPVCVYILVDLAGAWLPLSQTLISWAEHLLLSASRWQQWVTDMCRWGSSLMNTNQESLMESQLTYVPWDPRAVASFRRVGKEGSALSPKSPFYSLQAQGILTWQQESNEPHLKIWSFPGPGTLSAHTHWAASVAVPVCLRCSVSLDSIVLGFFSLPQCQVACV